MMEPSRKLPSVPKRLLKEKRPVTVAATKPGQIVCWDVTFLPHVFTGSRFAACVFVDLYSRQIIGFEVGYRESAAGASALCRTVIDRVAAAGGRVCVLHSDNGSVMTSTQVADVCEDHRVVQSFIRPRVSNDNAHVESLSSPSHYLNAAHTPSHQQPPPDQ